MQSTQQATRDGSRTEPTCPPKARSHATVHRFRIKPADVGIVGFVDGGTLLEWIDKAAYATATQWCGSRCVAASVGNLHLDRPISVGELVEVHASLVYTGRSSLHILVTVYSRDPTRAKVGQTSQCPIIFVAVDDAGNPVEVVTTGRHDPCVGLRATPICEAMLAIVLMDHCLRHRGQNADVNCATPVIPGAAPR